MSPTATSAASNPVQTAMQEKASQCSSFQKQEDLQPEQREILREKVYCGDCGSMMRSCKGIGRANKDGERNVFLYYDCGRFMDSGRATCSTHYIRHEEIMDALRNALDAQVRTAIDFETFVKEIQAMPKVVCYRCVQLCLRTSVPGVDVPVQIQESYQSHTRNNPGRNLPGSCRRWQNRLRNSPERHRAF